jgi:ATP-binding cassette subfamily C (CFTR/MRP) protein 4
MNLVSQAIEGVRVMKMSGWENELQKRILAARAKEIHQIHKANRCKAANEGMFFITYGVVSTIIFIFHVFVFGGTLVTKDVFTIFSLISVMQLEMTKHLSLGVYACAELWISVSRIQKFLETPELEKPSSKSMEDDNAMSDTEKEDAIVLKNLTCYWGKRNEESDDGDAENSDNADEVVALDNIDLSFKKNELTFVVGAVGSGKSALLYALAGELLPDHGQIDRSHSTLAYAAQNPWIMNGTVRENILMGAEYDQQFYQEVVEACGLIQDFTQFIHGDETIVGDRGVQCSGGQKARIGLARALYIDADVVLLDDPLSAVDSKVGRHIFYEAVQGLGLKRGKCVVLVTHQHQYIGSGRCIHISNGKVKSIGTFEDCVKNSDGTLHLVSHNAEDLEESIHNVEAEDTDKPVKSSKVKNVSQKDPIQGASKQVDQQETKITGVVTKSTFLHYARSMGGLMTVAGLLMIFLIASAMNLINTVVVGRWSEFDPESQKSGRILITVLGLIALYITFSFLQSLTTFALTIRASKRLHDKMVAAILRAKIEFFDTNPSGRILNRFAGDTGSNDDLLPATVFDFTMCLFYVSGAILTAIVALPFILVVMPPLIWYFLRVRKIFVITSRELKRFEGLARSPIFAMLSESINGISTIRPNGVETYISKKFEDYHDTHSRAFWSFLASSRWLGFRMDFLMYVNCSASCFLAVLFNVEGWFEVDPVIFGLALSLLIQLGSIFQWTIRQSAEIVNQMVCVERVTEYSKVEPEAALITGRDADADLASWPVNGSIEVTDLSVRYRESLPLSLNSVTFSVPSGKRLGIVGRTGSGKSTLVQALFRILEAENGKIMVDGVDISELGLHKLRTGLSVINQYPVLFSGCTVRENLDPFGRYSKEEVVEALTDVQMIEVVNALPQGMNSQVADGGMNFSVGERQLLCLARAMLQKSKILVLDEPTANVDGRTDKLLQQAVDKSFKGATIISVAHRLDTIIENDLILVLGRGEVLEFGSPSELLSIEDGQFTSMVNDTGAEMSRALKATAMRNQK